MCDDPAELSVNVSRMWSNVVTLGPGRRLGLWVQGCPIGCPGCSAVDTWDSRAGQPVNAYELARLIVTHVRADGLTGLTITGGEPSEQGPALAACIDEVRSHCADLDVLMFTGRSLAAARTTAPRLCETADCVVAGPYRQDLPLVNRLVASSNQSVVYQSAETRRRYEDWLENPGPEIQVFADGDDLWLVGLTRPGDLSAFASGLAERGIELEGASWLR